MPFQIIGQYPQPTAIVIAVVNHRGFTGVEAMRIQIEHARTVAAVGLHQYGRIREIKCWRRRDRWGVGDCWGWRNGWRKGRCWSRWLRRGVCRRRSRRFCGG